MSKSPVGRLSGKRENVIKLLTNIRFFVCLIRQICKNAVVNQLGSYGKISFYNQRGDAEIDVILKATIGLETKINGGSREAVKLQKLSKKLGLESSFIISQSYQEGGGVCHLRVCRLSTPKIS